MAKLIFACGMLSSVTVIDPAQMASIIGPTAQGIVLNVQHALNIDSVMPALKRVASR
jgi:hypothetical protein